MWKIPGVGALLATLGVEIDDGTVTLPFDLGPGASFEVAGVAWATVELERAEAELGPRLGTTFEAGPRDGLLGASVRRSTAAGPRILLVEPDTEGRLSGALARHGEGPVALYLRLEPGASTGPLPAGISTRAGSGPLGPERIVLAGSPWGPFIILVGVPPPDGPDRVPSGP